MSAQLYDWLLRFTVAVLLLLIFVFILFRPLWKLAMSRPALIIVFSRAVANFLSLCANFPNFVIFYMLDASVAKSFPQLYSYVNNGIVKTLECALHMHNLALAANRAHAICFPFHYTSFYAKKGNIFLICLLLWLLALSFGISDYFIRRLLVMGLSPADTANRVCMAIAGLSYTVLGCRLVWMKYFKPSIAGASMEQDSIRILVVCMACLLMSALRLTVLLPLTVASLGWPDVPKTIFYWTFNGASWITLCTEEILLAILVADFRQNLKRQFLVIFCCKHTGTEVSTTATIMSANANVVKVNNLVRGTR